MSWSLSTSSCSLAVMLMLTFSADAAPRHYEHLKDAVAEIDRVIAADRLDELKASMPSPAKDEPSGAITPETFEVLKLERKKAGSLEKLYADREFPADAQTFKLGGHDRELGHVHIDFVRERKGWLLCRIWVCR